MNCATLHTAATTLIATLLLTFSRVAPADEPASWPRWRGASGLAVATGARLPNVWPAEPQPRWEVKTGVGWSSPVVVDGRVFVTDRVGGVERTLAFKADDGTHLWMGEHPVDFDPHQVGRRHGNGPKSTALVDEGRVYSLGIAGWLECFDAATGKSLWHVNFPAAFGAPTSLPDQRAFVDGTASVVVPIGQGQGAPVPLFGYTGSLTLAGNKLICSVGGARGGTIQAFDKLTGRVIWKSLDENVSYSSPIVATLAGVEQVVVMTGPRVVGLAVDDGRLLWSYPYQIQYDESISTPVVSGDTVYVSGDGHPLTALHITRQGDRLTVNMPWDNIDLASYLSSMVVYNGHLYGMNDVGEFVCVRLSDGKTLWSDGDHGYYCSPVLAGDRLLGLNESGELAVVAADPASFRLLGKSRLVRSATWSMPAIVENRIYVRAAASVRCFEF